MDGGSPDSPMNRSLRGAIAGSGRLGRVARGGNRTIDAGRDLIAGIGPGTLVVALVATIATVWVFSTGLAADFVSDAWVFIDRARQPIHSLLPHLIPSGESFYRPVVEAAFWVQLRLFGLEPLPYHLVALGCHVISSMLVGAIAWELSRARAVAIGATFAFLFAIQAHEVVFDVADLHNAIGGVLLFGATYLFIRGAHIWAASLTVLLLLTDESGLLVLPIAVLFLVTTHQRAWSHHLRSVAPIAIVTAAYIVWRMAYGGFGNEVRDPCATAECVVAGIGQYLNRLVLRPDVMISKEASTLAILAVVFGLAILLRPWRWRSVRAAVFGAGWVLGTSLFFVVALWPYTSDRFMYIPSGGLAILFGVFVSEAVSYLRDTRGSVRVVVPGLVLVLLTAWVAVGAWSLNGRGLAWTAAGERAASIVSQVRALHPYPAPNATFSFRGVPVYHQPLIPPGGTPFVFNNGLPQALRIAYGRWDIADRGGSPRRSAETTSSGSSSTRAGTS